MVENPKLVEIPAMKFAGFIFKTSIRYGQCFRDIPKFWQEYTKSGDRERLHQADCIKPGAEYGVNFTSFSGTGQVDYLIGMKLKEGADAAAAGFEVRDVPPSVYAVFSSPPVDEREFIAVVRDTWAFIIGEWIPKSDYFINGSAFDFERHDERSRGQAGKSCEIYIPVMKKTAS
jgi:AraC family transcriptional regulator